MPVPVAPVISTEMSYSVARRASARTSATGLDGSWTMRSNSQKRRSALRLSETALESRVWLGLTSTVAGPVSRCRRKRLAASRTEAISFSGCQGLVM